MQFSIYVKAKQNKIRVRKKCPTVPCDGSCPGKFERIGGVEGVGGLSEVWVWFEPVSAVPVMLG